MSLLTELPTLGGADLRTQSTALWCATQGEGGGAVRCLHYVG